jgi:predicted DNA-binding transcriptional regulator YafY
MPRLILPPAYTRRIQRLLALINEIKTNPRQEPRLLCKALGVSWAMLYKDRQVLTQGGFTFRYDRGQRQHVITQNRFLPVLQLTSSEVLEPESLRQEARETARALVQVYGQTTGEG